MATGVRLTVALVLAFLATPALCKCDDGYQDVACVAALSDKADKELNQVYRKLLSLQDAEGKEKLKAAQRAWVIFRDADARFYSHDDGDGSQGAMVRMSRVLDLTTERTKQLRMHLPADK